MPPGTRPRSSSEVTRPASTSRAARPTRASRPGAENRWCSGRDCQRRSSSALSGCGTKRRNWASPGRRVPDRREAARGRARRPGSRRAPRAASGRSAGRRPRRTGRCAIGKNSSPSVNRRIGSWRASRSRSAADASVARWRRSRQSRRSPRSRHAPTERQPDVALVEVEDRDDVEQHRRGSGVRRSYHQPRSMARMMPDETMARTQAHSATASRPTIGRQARDEEPDEDARSR